MATDFQADLIDVICVNRYYGWYIDMGQLDWINQSVYWDISQWSEKYKRPILVTEYGADSLPGLNQVRHTPSPLWIYSGAKIVAVATVKTRQQIYRQFLDFRVRFLINKNT